MGVQDDLTEETFQERLVGFKLVTPKELFNAPRGGMLRYAIDAPGQPTKYRIGGILLSVDKSLGWIYLMSYSFKWRVTLNRPGQSIRLYYRPKIGYEEIDVFRKLLERLEKGEISIVKNA